MRSLAMIAALAVLSVPALGLAQMRQQGRPQAQPPASAELTERLVMTPPPGWQTGGSSATKNMVSRQLLPPGQTPENWTEMISVQIVADPNADPRDHVQRVVDASRSSCEASGPSPVAEAQSNGYPMATLTVTCTRGRQTGKGGVVAVRAIRGQAALYVVQRFWRGPAFGPNESPAFSNELRQDWANFLRNVSVCDMNEQVNHPCPKAGG